MSATWSSDAACCRLSTDARWTLATINLAFASTRLHTPDLHGTKLWDNYGRPAGRRWNAVEWPRHRSGLFPVKVKKTQTDVRVTPDSELAGKEVQDMC